MIVIHVDLADNELKEAVREAIKGEIVSLTRDAMSEIVGQTVHDKIAISHSTFIENEIKKQIREYIVKQMESQMWIDQGKLKSEFSELVKQVVYEVLQRSLRNNDIIKY